MHLYLTHDTDDVELIDLLVDILNSIGFSVFVSPFDLPGKIPKFDGAKKSKIENCDVLVCVFTRKSLRSILIKKEIDFARSKNKPIIPLKEWHAKLKKIGRVIGEYVLGSFWKEDVVAVADIVLTRIGYTLPIIDVSQDFITNARKKLKNYAEQPIMMGLSKAARRATFQGIVVDAFKELGYSIREESGLPYKSAHYRFNISATKDDSQIRINCLFRPIHIRDVKRFAGDRDLSKRPHWVVCVGVDPEAQTRASVVGIDLVPIDSLLNELPTSSKQTLWQKYLRIVHAKAESIIDEKHYPDLLKALRTVRIAKTNLEKGRSLETLAECFVKLFSGLEVAGRNVRIEAEELDLVVKNEIEKIFWVRLGTPIIVECKNWTKLVGAREIRDLVLKMREVRTALLITTLGVTSRDGAIYEIIEARKKGKYILILNIEDIEEILRGTNPEEIIKSKFYSLWMYH